MGATIGSPTKRAMIKTGTYTGDGNDNRNINIGIDLNSKPWKFVMVKVQGSAFYAIWRPGNLVGDLGLPFDAAMALADTIQAFTSTGFQVGTNNIVNQNLSIYHYMASWENP